MYMSHASAVATERSLACRRCPSNSATTRGPGITRQPPKVGEHNADVLTEHGFTANEIAKLTESGILVSSN